MTTAKKTTPPSSESGASPVVGRPVLSCPGEIQKALGFSDSEFKEKCRKCAGKVADTEIWSSKKMQEEYRKTLKDPNVKTGADVQAEVRKSLASQGYMTVTQGTTDSSGNIKVKKQKGPCAKLKEKATEIHEKVHQDHTKDLEKKHGKGTSAFKKAWNDASDWVQDEINAHAADQKFWNDFKAECKA
ncbi:hypothetical protein [Candidatus Thiosymbion oneisti]|uniref:hypothetical protein n=1 Tax=Candidatus Thiosymbion oneisti TaxID=589554 RepID=UPI00105C5D60|nr:hypothetical protein [Candidatus Thiosymbion oneisti]